MLKHLIGFDGLILFYVLVHSTSKSPGENIGLLAIALTGECSSVVYGMGGGKEAYKEALSTFKRVYGRRDVMLASCHLSLEAVEPGQAGDEFCGEGQDTSD